MKALAGIRVLDLTHMLSGPYAGMLLADLGAEVIKVEPPGSGEGTRRLLADDPQNSLHGMGAYFLTLNRNKRSVTLNLKHAAGLALFYELAQTADVVLDNFSAGVTSRLGIDHESLAAVNPGIVTCTITGFGESGPETARPAYDMVAQAMGGGMSITGQPGGPPTRAGIPFGDLCGGMMGVVGLLAALLARQQTGVGQHVDISMLDVQVSMLNYMATMHFLSGEIPDKIGNTHFVHVPYNTFPASDGYIILAVVTDDFWANLMSVVDAPELNTEEHATLAGRWRDREQINGRLSELFQKQEQAYWIEQLSAARIPCAPVNNLAQALHDPQVLARNMVVEVAHPAGGSVRMPGNPVKLSADSDEQFNPPPLLGADTEAILLALGKTPAELARLHEAGTI